MLSKVDMCVCVCGGGAPAADTSAMIPALRRRNRAEIREQHSPSLTDKPDAKLERYQINSNFE